MTQATCHIGGGVSSDSRKVQFKGGGRPKMTIKHCSTKVSNEEKNLPLLSINIATAQA